MKAVSTILIVFVLLLFAAPAAAQECDPEPVQLQGAGTAIPGFVPGEAYIIESFSEEMDELIFLGINGKADIIHQDAKGFTAILYLDQSGDLDYTYLAGGYRCQMIYRVRLPLISGG